MGHYYTLLQSSNWPKLTQRGCCCLLVCQKIVIASRHLTVTQLNIGVLRDHYSLWNIIYIHLHMNLIFLIFQLRERYCVIFMFGSSLFCRHPSTYTLSVVSLQITFKIATEKCTDRNNTCMQAVTQQYFYHRLQWKVITPAKKQTLRTLWHCIIK